MEKILMPCGDSFLLSVVGMIFVFAILIFMLIATGLLAKISKLISRLLDQDAKIQPKQLKPITTEISGEIKIANVNASGGEIALYDVDDATAVMLMAIVADKTEIPLNELMFKSIREVQ